MEFSVSKWLKPSLCLKKSTLLVIGKPTRKSTDNEPLVLKYLLLSVSKLEVFGGFLVLRTPMT